MVAQWQIGKLVYGQRLSVADISSLWRESPTLVIDQRSEC